MNIGISPEESNILTLAATKYTSNELDDIVACDEHVERFNEVYPFECVRFLNQSYRVAYLGSEHIAIIYFDKTGKKTFGKVYNISVEKACFDLKENSTLNEVMNVDPLGNYLFLYTGRNDNRVSQHFTSDGYLVSISYDDMNTILDIHVELI